MISVRADAIDDSGGSRVVRRMLFGTDDSEPSAADSRRFSLPTLPSNSQQHKTPTKCNLLLSLASSPFSPFVMHLKHVLSVITFGSITCSEMFHDCGVVLLLVKFVVF